MHKAIQPPPACVKQQDTKTQNSKAVRPTMTGKNPRVTQMQAENQDNELIFLLSG